MRLRFLREGQSFGCICEEDEVERYERVASHNGGRISIEKREGSSVFIRVTKCAEER
ncbi:MAG: hypothetical protein LLF99_18855 [Desulfobacteraceae bacterium]|nr:hypothetical protein [Desulfobacteraceae bacterium]